MPDLSIFQTHTMKELSSLLDGHGVRYCFLRGWHNPAPTTAGYECDLLCDAEDRDDFAHFVELSGFARMPSRGHEPHEFFVGYDHDVQAWIKLDVVTDLRYGRPVRALSFGSAEGPLARRVLNTGLPTLAPGDEILHLVLHGLLDKPGIAPGYRERLKSLYRKAHRSRRDLDIISLDYERALGGSLPWSLFVDACERDAWAALEGRRRAVIREAVRREPVLVARRVLAAGLARLLARPRGARLSRGCLIALLGPDGAGKTTLAEGIAASAPFQVRRIYMGHGLGEAGREPRFMRALACLAGEVRPGTETRSNLHRARRWAARIALQTLRSIEVRVRRSVGHLVVMDRHVLDLMLDKHRRSRTRRSIARLLQWVCPQPDLVVLLDAPVHELQRRKPAEHSYEDLTAQRRAYVQLCQQLPHGIVVNCNRSAAEVRNEVMTQVWAQYTRAGREAVR